MNSFDLRKTIPLNEDLPHRQGQTTLETIIFLQYVKKEVVLGYCRGFVQGSSAKVPL